MNIIKRSGIVEEFSKDKIRNVILTVNNQLESKDQLSNIEIVTIVNNVYNKGVSVGRILTTDEVQNLIEDSLLSIGAFAFAKKMIYYKFEKKDKHKFSNFEKSVLAIIDNRNAVINEENANKNASLLTVQRDYLAGEISKHLVSKKILPSDILDAHIRGEIHFHDMDYALLHMHNCDLVNLQDMLQSGTVISGIKINKPKTFSTACNITCQIIALVASSQYGGQTITLTHLAPFVNESRKYFRDKLIKDMQTVISYNSLSEDDKRVIENIVRDKKQKKKNEQGRPVYSQNERINNQYIYDVVYSTSSSSSSASYTDDQEIDFQKTYVVLLPVSEVQFNDLLAKEVNKDIKDGVQTLQYQILTLQSTNGQSPFVSIAMYLNEAEDEETKKDLAVIIEEVLKQRIKGVQNEDEAWIAPTFPKLLYFLEKDNITEDSKYWYLTKLAAVCVTKRMVPDFMSEKEILEQKYPRNTLLTTEQRRNLWGDPHIYGLNPFLNLSEDEMREIDEYSLSENYSSPDLNSPALLKIKPILQKHNININLVRRVAYPCMGCRSQLTPDPIHYRYYGRFNQGVVTINLPYVALKAKGDKTLFFAELDKTLEICHRALRIRHEYLLGTSSEGAPILWKYGAITRLNRDERIDRLLYDNFSTISLGYVGLFETVKCLTGNFHSDEDTDGYTCAKEIMEYLNAACAKWRKNENISYSLYGTPEESTTTKFANALQSTFGMITGITDKNYVTNSYHIPVFKEIDAFEKIRIESVFAKLSPGGAISYVETPNLEKNPEAILEIIKYIYSHITYCECNTQLTYCQACHSYGTVKLCKNERTGKLEWTCQNCGNNDNRTLDCVVRLCGYLGKSNLTSNGRLWDIHDRVFHL